MTKSSVNAIVAVIFLLCSSFAEQVSANTIFEALFPTKCVNPKLNAAGFCVLNKGCTSTCFAQPDGSLPEVDSSATVNNEAASPLSLNSPALQNFYIPVDAVECDQFLDPICPATNCCPACKKELDDLYRCLILESDYHYLDFLARSCKLNCPIMPVATTPPVTTTTPPVVATTPPVTTTTPPVVATTPPVTTTTPPVVATTPPVTTTTPPVVVTTPPVTTTTPPVVVTTPPVTTTTPPVVNSTVPPAHIDGNTTETLEPPEPIAWIAPDWVIPADLFSPFPMMTVRVGDSLKFSWTRGTHDVWIYPNSLQSSCDRTGKIQIGSTRDNPTTYVFQENDAGKTITFACDIGSHCELGMIMDVNVLPSIEEELLMEEQELLTDVEEADVVTNGDLNKDIVIISTNEGVVMTDLHHNTVTNMSP